MSRMLAGATSFNKSLYFINTHNVTDVSSMFAGATSFNNELIMDFNNVTNMSSMFDGATSFNNGGNPLSMILNMSNLIFHAYDHNCPSWLPINKPWQLTL